MFFPIFYIPISNPIYVRGAKLIDVYPELAEQIDLSKLTVNISSITFKSQLKIDWSCPIDIDHRWSATVTNRTTTYEKRGSLTKEDGTTWGCPFCGKVKPSKGYNLKLKLAEEDLTHKWLGKDADGIEVDFERIMPYTSTHYAWLCDTCDNEYLSQPKDVFREGHRRRKYCSDCKFKERGKEYQKRQLKRAGSLLDHRPDVVNHWDYEKNNDKPEDVSPQAHQNRYFICKVGHGSYLSLIYNWYNGVRCPDCSTQTSVPEIRIFSELAKVTKNVRWRDKIGGKEIDIILDDEKIGIEVDGYPWHKDKLDEDIKKDEVLKNHGYSSLRVRDIRLEKYPGNSIEVDLSKFDYSDFLTLLSSFIEITGDRNWIRSAMERSDFSAEDEFRKITERLPRPAPEESLLAEFPEASNWWDYEKNHPLKPEYFTTVSNREFFWQCKEGHTFKRKINRQFRRERKGNERGGVGLCPYCPKPKIVKIGQEIEIEGEKFSSLTAACRHYGISRSSCYHYSKYHNVPLEQVIRDRIEHRI